MNAKAILSVIEKRKPNRRTYQQNEEVYYETTDGNALASVVAASGNETSYFTNGDWAYNWQIVARGVIPAALQ